MVIIGEMLHNIFNTAIENVTELVNRINLDILILAQTIDL